MLTEDQWELAPHLLTCLQPIRSLTLQLQDRTHVIISLFLSLLKECTDRLSRLASTTTRGEGDLPPAGRKFAAALLKNVNSVGALARCLHHCRHDHDATGPAHTPPLSPVGPTLAPLAPFIQRFEEYTRGDVPVIAVAMQCDPRTFHLTEVDSVHIDTFVQHFDDAMEKVRLQRVCRV